ncbi:MAG: Na(+)/H(+) antiporter subunit D [Rhodospirillaceae bacterium]|nr:Na(+)/H(+) antiporter subunit D [Rhodospirillaceae bacterium]
MTSSVAPFLIFYIGAAGVMLTRGMARQLLMLSIPLIGAWNLYILPTDTVISLAVFDYTLTVFKADRLSMLFGYLFHLAAFIGAIYSIHVKNSGEHVAGVMYAGSALGAVFVGDMISLFVFWEMLALTSVFLVLARNTERANSAAMRYIIIQVLSGVILLAGVLLRLHNTGTIAFTHIGLDGSLASQLIFLAFGIKCAFPLLHNWLTDAYPEATPSGTVYLSAFTTKVAVYALARSYAGTEILVYIGATMAMFPIFFAVIENDLRRVLAYSLINQIGFMVVGIGIGSELAMNGAISHAFNDVIFKGLLFMSMGAVLYRTGKMDGSALGGLYKSMPKTAFFCIIGAASISAFPLFSGFVSKSMVMVAALDEGYELVWLALLFASAGVFHHAGIKIPFFAFFAHDSGIRCKEAPTNMLIAMGLAAIICVFNGSYPWVLYSMLPFPVDYAPYTAAHVLTQTQLLFFSALAFTILKLMHIYPPELPGINIDAEWSYRMGLPKAVQAFKTVFGPLDQSIRKFGLGIVTAIIGLTFRFNGPNSALARTALVGSMVQWVIVLLGVYLALFLISSD